MAMKEGDLELLQEIARFEDSHDMEKEFKIGWSGAMSAFGRLP